MPRKKAEINNPDESALRKIKKEEGFKADSIDGFIDGFKEGYNEGADLSKRKHSLYLRYLMGCWDEYAFRKAMKEELLKIAEEDVYEIICHMLRSGKHPISEIAKITHVNEAFVRTVERINEPTDNFPPVSAIHQVK